MRSVRRGAPPADGVNPAGLVDPADGVSLASGMPTAGGADGAPGAGRPAEPAAGRPARATRPVRLTVRWRPLGRGTCVAAGAALTLSGCLPRLWDAATTRDPSAYRLTALLAGALALLARTRRAADEPDIHDRQVDYLVGLPLLVLAAGVLSVPPARYHGPFWLAHADLLALPLLAAGAIAVVFGTRALWRQRLTLTAWLGVLVPLTAPAARKAADVLAAPALALARLAGTGLGGWHAVASPPGDAVMRAGSGGEIAYGPALRGVAGVLAAAAIVIVFAATATSRRGLSRRALASAAVCVAAITGRILLATLVGAAGGPGGANAVLGWAGDLVTLGVIAAAGAAIGLRQLGTGAPGGRAAAAGGRRTRRRAPVPRARLALAVLALVCAGLAVLDIAGNRTAARSDASRSDAAQSGTPQSGTTQSGAVRSGAAR